MPLTSSAPFVRDPPSYSETPQPGETSIFLETVSPSKHQSNFDYGAYGLTSSCIEDLDVIFHQESNNHYPPASLSFEEVMFGNPQHLRKFGQFDADWMSINSITPSIVWQYDIHTIVNTKDVDKAAQFYSESTDHTDYVLISSSSACRRDRRFRFLERLKALFGKSSRNEFFEIFHNVDTFQHGGCGLPSEFLRSCQGVIVCEKIFSDESYRPEPFSDEEFCHDRHMLEASLYYVRKHNQLPDKTSRILEQTQQVTAIPLCKVTCYVNGTIEQFYIAGTQHRVFFPQSYQQNS